MGRFCREPRILPNFHQKLVICFAAMFFASGFTLLHGADQKRFVAMLEDGRIVEDDVLRNWYSGNASPQLAGQSLLSGGNPMRFMIDRTLKPLEPPTEYIEFHSGDRLPGQVVGHQPQQTRYSAEVPEHFTVIPNFSFRVYSDKNHRTELRIRREFVRKIVWRQLPAMIDQHQPSTIFLNNGQQIEYRAIRFSSLGVQLLLDSERMTIGFSEIAELHFDEPSAWDLHLRELAILFPGGTAESPDKLRFVQWETAAGLVATTCTTRIDADSRGDNNNSDRWVHGIQPAWSLDLLWIPCSETWTRRSWKYNEIPLFRWPYQETREGAMFSRNGFSMRRNRNSLGELAVAADRPLGWNLGVMAPSRLQFKLPPLLSGFSTHVAIDRSTQSGGCVSAEVHASWLSEPVLQTEAFTGSADMKSLELTHWNDVPKDASLVLKIDPVFDSFPKGADPFDIRDLTNWIEPFLVIDADKLQQEIRRRTPDTLVALDGWKWNGAADDIRYFSTRRRVEYSHEGQPWRTTVASREQPIVLTRSQEITPESRYLEVSAAKFEGSNDHPMIEVIVNGLAFLRQPLRSINPRDHVNSPPALLVDLAPFVGTKVEVSISQAPGSEDAPVDWRGINFVSAPTYLREILQNPTSEQVAQWETPEGEPAPARVNENLRWISRPVVEIKDGPWVQIATFDSPLEIRERPLPGQYRMLRFGVAKLGGGHLLMRFQYVGDEEEPAIYSIGSRSDQPGLVAIEKGKLKDGEWRVPSHDLFNHFDSIDITGIAVQSLEGNSTLLDHFYLAGSWDHLERVPYRRPDQNNYDDWEKRIEDLKPRLEQAVVQFPHGDSSPQSGFVVNQHERIVAVPTTESWKVGSTTTVTLSDGTKRTAKRLGQLPELQLGLIEVEKTEEEAHLPTHFDLTHRNELDREFSCLLLQRDVESGELQYGTTRAMTHDDDLIVLRPVPEFTVQVGAFALDANHQVCGIVSSVTPAGFPVLRNIRPLRDNWEQLKQAK